MISTVDKEITGMMFPTRPFVWMSLLAIVALAGGCGEEDDAAQPLPGGNAATLHVTGAETAELDLKGSSHFINCENTSSGVFIRAAVSGTDVATSDSVKHLDIDLFGDIGTGEYTAVPETDSDAMPARGFRIFYHPENALKYYVNQATSTPCTLTMSDATDSRLALGFSCANLVHSDDAARKVIIRGSIRCARR